MMLQQSAETLSEILTHEDQRDIPHRDDLFSSSFSSDKAAFNSYRTVTPDGLPFPHVIIPQSGDIEDLFATVATYYPDQTPLTALIYILSSETSSLLTLTSIATEHTNFKWQDRCRRACLGAALGEAVLASLEVTADSSILPFPSYSTMRRTLAFTLGRSQQLYGGKFPANRLAKRWMRMRQMTGLGYTQTTIDAVLHAHELANDSVPIKSKRLEANAIFYSAVHDLIVGDDPNGYKLESVIADIYPDSAHFLHELSSVFDGRIRAFSQLVEIILSHSNGKEIDEITVGYICNRILPSSFSYAGVLTSFSNFFPAALIWYGFFSALTGPSKTTSLDSGLLSKLERDLVESFTFEQRPRCDIAIEELEVLSRTKIRHELIKPTQQRALLVGLLPGVDVYTRFGNETDQSIERIRRDTEISKIQEQVTGLLQEALQMLKMSSTNPNTMPPTTKRTKRRVR